MVREGDEAEGSDAGFRVEDKRRFTESGDPRAGDDAETEEARPQDPGEAAGAGGAGPGRPAGEQPPSEPAHEHAQADAGLDPAVEITFSGFVNGFAIQALMALGLMPDAASGVIVKNLAEARTMIDILAMLREKTAGNLSDEEDRMMEEMLYDLRMQYVREVRGETGSEGDLG